MKRVKWACPNGCPSVLGPQRPRRDDVARYCLPCSSVRGRLVLRTAPSLESKRAAKVEREKAAAERAKERKKEREAKAEEKRALLEAERLAKLPRQHGVDYVIQVPDESAGDGTRTVATYGREEFAEALRAYLAQQKRAPAAKLLKVYESGEVYVPIMGWIETMRVEDTKAGWRGARRIERGKHLIGWNRIEPVYRGTRHWLLDPSEKRVVCPPGRFITRTSVRDINRRLVRRAGRPAASRFFAPETRDPEHAPDVDLTPEQLRREHDAIGDWDGQGMNEDGSIE